MDYGRSRKRMNLLKRLFVQLYRPKNHEGEGNT